MATTPTDRKASREPAAAKGRRRGRGLFGVRHPVGRLVLDLLVFGALAVGGYFAAAKHLSSLMESDEGDGVDEKAINDQQQQELEDWQRTRKGWERLFESACRSWPGYIVDVGLPARLKLVQIGPDIRPMMWRKLESASYAERISAIYILAAVSYTHLTLPTN